MVVVLDEQILLEVLFFNLLPDHAVGILLWVQNHGIEQAVLDGRDEPFLGVVKVLGVAGHVLNGCRLGAHDSGAVGGGAIAAAAIDPVADRVAC